MKAFFDVPELATSRLRIRALDLDDAPAVFAIFSHPEVMRYWGTTPMTALSQAVEKIGAIQDHYRSGDLLQLAIERRDDRQLIGTCTLHQIHLQNRRAEIGYVLGHEHWGRGYMHEALCAFVRHAFDAMKLHRLEADIDPRNLPSARSLERLGFQREGLLRERWIVGDEVSDSALYGLLAADWWRQQARPSGGASQ